jgi:hypothetical protein
VINWTVMSARFEIYEKCIQNLNAISEMKRPPYRCVHSWAENVELNLREIGSLGRSVVSFGSLYERMIFCEYGIVLLQQDNVRVMEVPM